MSSRSAQKVRRFGPRGGTSEFARYKDIPAGADQRDAIRAAAEEEVAGLNGGWPLTGEFLQAGAHRVLQRLKLAVGYLGFTMVVVANAYWMRQLRAIPYDRRLLLLPRCMGTVGKGDCLSGSAEQTSVLDTICTQAESLGYRVLIADGTPIVVKILAEKNVEAIIGAACLDSLEAVFEKVWQLGVPAVAVPLLSANCRNTTADLAWLEEFVASHDPAAEAPKRNWLPVLQAATGVFEPDRLAELLAPIEPAADAGPLGLTGRIAHDWLSVGGKRLRPFVTLAAATALAEAASPDDLPVGAYRAAVAIEAFHKASLAHDDIEDEDDQRYGRPTLHRLHGQAAAINVGDYLLGLGYRLIASLESDVGSAKAGAILTQMSRAHVRLAQGQGAELAWRTDGQLAPSPGDVLRVYALKTAPAFAAALGCGAVLGGAGVDADGTLAAFSRYVGVGFQLLNDLADWEEDLRAARPTYLTALAAELAGEKRDELLGRIPACADSDEAIAEMGGRFEQLGVFEQAGQLVERLRDRARKKASGMTPSALRELCGFLVDLILT